ncbi:hypothetical protein DFH94DRAFT_603659, partial [Russula ochroleuca]
ARWRGRSRLPFFCGDLTPRELRVPTQRLNTKHPNGALSIAHLRALAPPSVFAGVASELTEIVGEPPIEAYKDENGVVLVWLLDLPGQVATLWHSQLMLCEPDFESEAESRFVQTHGAGVFEVGMSVDESGGQAALVGYVSWES